MGAGDKISNKTKDATDKVKEKIGVATDSESLQAEGLKNQAIAKAKQAGKHLKDLTYK